VVFFVGQHNSVLHSSFKGRTQDEVYARTAQQAEVELAEAGAKARQQHTARNRAAHCSSCPKAA